MPEVVEDGCASVEPDRLIINNQKPAARSTTAPMPNHVAMRDDELLRGLIVLWAVVGKASPGVGLRAPGEA